MRNIKIHNILFNNSIICGSWSFAGYWTSNGAPTKKVRLLGRRLPTLIKRMAFNYLFLMCFILPYFICFYHNINILPIALLPSHKTILIKFYTELYCIIVESDTFHLPLHFYLPLHNPAPVLARSKLFMTKQCSDVEQLLRQQVIN